VRLLLFNVTYFFFALRLLGQGSFTDNGVYLSQNDFTQRCVSLPAHSIDDALYELPKGSIRLVREGKGVIFRFGEIYGYRARGCDFVAFGKPGLFRLYGYFQILDEGPLVIYYKRFLHGKHLYTNVPYFSLTIDSKKFPLSVYHLRKKVLITKSTARDVRWIKKRIPLETKINNQCIVNTVLGVPPWGDQTEKVPY
jgi:hypothetical protein